MFSMNRALRILGVIAVTGGVFAGGMVLGTDGDKARQEAAAAPARYYQEGEIPAYPGSLEYSMGDDLNVNGIRTRVSYFYTDDAPEKVVDFYSRKLTKAGLSPRVTRRTATEANVYALNQDQSGQISVTVVADGARTIVFPSIIPLSGRIISGSVVKSRTDIPFSPDAVGIMDVSSENESGAFLSYVEPRMDVLTALGHIRDDMGRRNWSIEEYRQNVDGSGRVAFVQVRKGGEHMAFNISKVTGNEGVTVTVNTIASSN